MLGYQDVFFLALQSSVGLYRVSPSASLPPIMTPSSLPAGLFHRAVLMSGSAYSSWALVDDPVHYAVRVATALNCTIPRSALAFFSHTEISYLGKLQVNC